MNLANAVRSLLPTIRVPTLVVQHADDRLITPTMGKNVADHISGAKYVELAGRNMYHFVEPWRESFEEVHEFITGRQPEMTDDRVLATVLFTDIVGSTRMAAQLGDSNWRALLDATTPSCGRSSRVSADGRSTPPATASSRHSTARGERSGVPWQFAMRCRRSASRCGRACTPASANCAATTSAGSPCTSERRVSALAQATEVLVSSTLRDLVIGSGLEFDDRGAHTLKGVPGEWHLFAVAIGQFRALLRLAEEGDYLQGAGTSSVSSSAHC
jgi:hypothetical protein